MRTEFFLFVSTFETLVGRTRHCAYTMVWVVDAPNKNEKKKSNYEHRLPLID